MSFEQVLDLVRQRRVYLRAGFAYVPAGDLVSIVANQVADASHRPRRRPQPRLCCIASPI